MGSGAGGEGGAALVLRVKDTAGNVTIDGSVQVNGLRGLHHQDSAYRRELLRFGWGCLLSLHASLLLSLSSLSSSSSTSSSSSSLLLLSLWCALSLGDVASARADFGGGGAGGAIWIHTPRLFGSGVLEASGGDGGGA